MCEIGRICKETDTSFTSRGLSVGGGSGVDHKCTPYRNLVVEVADKFEVRVTRTLERGAQELDFKGDLCDAVGIKIFTRSVTMKPPNVDFGLYW